MDVLLCVVIHNYVECPSLIVIRCVIIWWTLRWWRDSRNTLGSGALGAHILSSGVNHDSAYTLDGGASPGDN